MFSLKKISRWIKNTNLYGLRKRFHEGIRLYVMPTFECTLDCAYCSTKMISGKLPEFTGTSFDHLIYEINNFFLPVREVVISGGEPFLYDRIDELINFLTSKFFVTVQSNASILRNIENIRQTSKLLFSCSYHQSELNINIFEKNIKKLCDHGFRVVVVDTEGAGIDSDVSEYIRDSREIKDECMDEFRWVIAPNGKKFGTFRDMFQSVEKLNKEKLGEIDNYIYKTWRKDDNKSTEKQ